MVADLFDVVNINVDIFQLRNCRIWCPYDARSFYKRCCGSGKLMVDVIIGIVAQARPLLAGTKKIAGILARKSWDHAIRLELTESQLIELRQFLHDFLISHLGRLPKGRVSALENAV